MTDIATGETVNKYGEEPVNPLFFQAELEARSADGRFLPGRSGNPGGRPTGSRNQATLLFERLIAENTQEVAEALLAKALDGNALALKLCVDRIMPPRRHERADFVLPPLVAAGDAAKALAAIAAAAASGEISAAEARDLTVPVTNFLRALEAEDFDKRLDELERKAGIKKLAAGSPERRINRIGFPSPMPEAPVEERRLRYLAILAMFDYIEEAAKSHGIDPATVAAVRRRKETEEEFAKLPPADPPLDVTAPETRAAIQRWQTALMAGAIGYMKRYQRPGEPPPDLTNESTYVAYGYFLSLEPPDSPLADMARQLGERLPPR